MSRRIVTERDLGRDEGAEGPCLAHLFDEPEAPEAGVSDAPEQY